MPVAPRFRGKEVIAVFEPDHSRISSFPAGGFLKLEPVAQVEGIADGFEVSSGGTIGTADDWLNLDFGPLGQAVNEPDFNDYGFDNPVGSETPSEEIIKMFDSGLGQGNKVSVKLTKIAIRELRVSSIVNCPQP